MKKIYGTFGVEMRAYGQKLVKFCKHTVTVTESDASKLVDRVVEITYCPGNLYILLSIHRSVVQLRVLKPLFCLVHRNEGQLSLKLLLPFQQSVDR